VDPKSVPLLGEAAQSLEHLKAKGRVRFEGAIPEGAVVAGKWADGAPWLLQQQTAGGGAIWTVGLPVSVQLSEFAFQPAFLALLDRAVQSAINSRHSDVNVVGEPWRIEDTVTGVSGPQGEIALPQKRAASSRLRSVTPERAGRYVFSSGKEESQRVATVDESEIVAMPAVLPEGQFASPRGPGGPAVDVSRQFAWLLLLLVALELGLRLRGYLRRSRLVAG
jgi:hypothetical protein